MRNPLKRPRREQSRKPLRERLAVLKAKAARVMRRQGLSAKPDPVQAAIEAHRAAFAAWDRLDRETSRCPHTDPRRVALMPAFTEAERREEEAWEALLATRATTTEGLRGLLGYARRIARG